MTTLKALLVSLGLWLARRGGWTPLAPCALAHLPTDDQVTLAKAIVTDIDARFPTMPGPVKAREALRVLLNLRPEAQTRDLNLLIELALH